MLLCQILASTKYEQKNKFKISAPTWNENFQLIDISYSVTNIQNCLEYIIKKHQSVTDNLPI